MYEDRPDEPQVSRESANDEHGSPPAHALFSHSKQFTVTGGNFTIYQHAAPSNRANFPVIPLGHLFLNHEMRPNVGSVTYRRRRGFCVRRMYSVRVQGSQTPMMAAVFQGDGAEEQWRKDVSKYSELRHPHLLQLYGIVSTGLLYAAVFHEYFIGFWDFLHQYHLSHFSSVFFWACVQAQLQEACQYILSVSGMVLNWSHYTPWIRPSTGVLSIELAPPESCGTALVISSSDFQPSTHSVLHPPSTSEIISLLSVEDYHRFCWHLCWNRKFTLSTNMPIKLGAVCHIPGPKYQDSFEVAFSADITLIDDGWSTEDSVVENGWHWVRSKEGTSILENGWICVNSACVAEKYRHRVYFDDVYPQGWLAQANHIFNALDIRSNLEDYLLVNAFYCDLQLLGPIENLPPGYLFLCPATDFGTDVPACLAIPTCPAYWSIDPSGAERLSAEEARILGFPDIDSWTEVGGLFWDSIDYGGIHQFHEAKAFDPDSREVAIHFGYPLFEVSCEQDDPVAHLQETDSDNYYSGSEGVSDCEDHQLISADAEDALVAEIALVFDAEMIGGLPVVPDVEMGSSGDLDGDNDVQEVAGFRSLSVSKRRKFPLCFVVEKFETSSACTSTHF